MVLMLLDIITVENQEWKILVKFFYLSNQVIIELLMHQGFKSLALRGKYYHIPNFWLYFIIIFFIIYLLNNYS